MKFLTCLIVRGQFEQFPYNGFNFVEIGFVSAISMYFEDLKVQPNQPSLQKAEQQKYFDNHGINIDSDGWLSIVTDEKDVLKTKFEQNISMLMGDTQGQQKDAQRQV